MSQPSPVDLIEFTESIGSRIDGFFYRGHNAADYAMIWVSSGFEALTGYEAGPFIAKRASFGDLIHPDDRLHVDEAVAAALATNGRWQIMYRLRSRDHGWRYVHETGGGCERDPETGEVRYLDGVILEADRMTSLAEKLTSGRTAVGSINGSVNEIFKTLRMLRLLSLNARIEAAHAKEHGAGFSVVAQEMMSLASAGESITRLIEAELGRLNDAIRI